MQTLAHTGEQGSWDTAQEGTELMSGWTLHERPPPHWDGLQWNRAECSWAKRWACTEENDVPGEAEETKLMAPEYI